MLDKKVFHVDKNRLMLDNAQKELLFVVLNI